MSTSYYSQHLTLPELRAKPENKHNRYLFKYVPAYPRPELHVSHLSHCTTLDRLRGIKRDSGFRDPSYKRGELKVVWFSLTVSPEELREAEGRSMTIVHPRSTEERFHPPESCGAAHCGAQRGRQKASVLHTFASSPAFESSSRLGSFRFTLSLQDVLDKYSQQFCGAQRPVMRVWKTIFYKQEVMYAVLVHSPTNQDMFSEFPLLQDEADSICAFRENPHPHFIWRPEAMCETHSFELLVNREENMLTVEPRATHDYYIWDCVSLALHVNDQVLEFGDMELRGSLRYCNMGTPPRPTAHFQTFEEAQTEVQRLWPLEMFSHSQFGIIH